MAKKSKVEKYTICMFCGGKNGHKDAEVCRLKGALAGALTVIFPQEWMAILDRTALLSEFEKRIKKSA